MAGQGHGGMTRGDGGVAQPQGCASRSSGRCPPAPGSALQAFDGGVPRGVRRGGLKRSARLEGRSQPCFDVRRAWQPGCPGSFGVFCEGLEGHSRAPWGRFCALHVSSKSRSYCANRTVHLTVRDAPCTVLLWSRYVHGCTAGLATFRAKAPCGAGLEGRAFFVYHAPR